MLSRDAIDHGVMVFFSKFAKSSEVMNRAIATGLDLPTFKLLPIMICLWFLWFDSRLMARIRVIQGFLGMFAALLLSRIMQNLAPLRLRPLHSGDPAFVPPVGLKLTALEHWSSFPSDHAAVSFALSTAVFRGSRPLGAACMLWSFFIVCLPRVYVGYHYMSDIAVGAIIGVSAVPLLEIAGLAEKIGVFASKLEKQWTGLFYVAFFVLSYQIVTMFDDIRRPANFLFQQR